MIKGLAALAILASSVIGFDDVGKGIGLFDEEERALKMITSDTRIVLEDATEVDTKLIAKDFFNPLTQIIGEITSIDEDVVLARTIEKEGNPSQIVNFSYENLRVRTDNGEVHRLVAPGPTDYVVGDRVKITYEAKSLVTSTHLFGRNNQNPFLKKYQPVQEVFFSAEGVAIRMIDCNDTHQPVTTSKAQ
jgi:hypothetical protein